MATTYTTLLAEVASYLGRADLTATIPTFVQFAQTRINRDVRCREMETKNASFSITGEYVNVPSDFLEAKHFQIPGSPALTRMSAEELDEYTTGGEPKGFEVVGSQFRFKPAPGTAVTATLIYYAKPATLVTTSAETNTLFPTVAPDLYLYASLLEAESFIQDDPRLPVWKAAYAEGVASLNGQAKRVAAMGGSMVTSAR